MKQIFSGAFAYCCRKSHELARLGYVITNTKQWQDGRWTFTMEKM